MDPWDDVRRAVADMRSGSLAVARRAARGMAALTTRRDVMRASRALLRAHPAMGALWNLCAEALDGDGAEAFAERLSGEVASASDAVRWVMPRRGAVVLTHSASGAVVQALECVRSRVRAVTCTWSLPGGEGRALARRLERAGFEVDLVPDAAIAQAAAASDLTLVGADAAAPSGVLNKVGTRLVALAARDAGIGCYAIACRSKLVPDDVAVRVSDPAFEPAPLALFDAVITERGPQRAGAIRRSASRVRIPDALLDILPRT